MNIQLFEPITYQNISELIPGEWIWDNKIESKLAHEVSMCQDKFILEPVGFRQVHILRLDDFPMFTSKPFMLSTGLFLNKDGSIHCSSSPYLWEYFEEGRFYRFKNGIQLAD